MINFPELTEISKYGPEERVLARDTACTRCFVRKSNSLEFLPKRINFIFFVAWRRCSTSVEDLAAPDCRGGIWGQIHLRGFCKRVVLCTFQYGVLPEESGRFCFVSGIL